jgi:hypothetical protein
MQRSLRDTDIDLCAGIRLFDSEDAHRVIGIARASTRWGGGVRYNDVRVVLTASTVVYARMALVMRVLGEDLVLIGTYRAPTNVGPRTPARKRLDELLGTILEFVPPSYREAWLIVPAASVVDDWKVEDDARNFCTPADLPRACVMLASGFDGRHALSAGKYHVRRPADLGRFTHYMTSILHDEYTFHRLSVSGRGMFLWDAWEQGYKSLRVYAGRIPSPRYADPLGVLTLPDGDGNRRTQRLRRVPQAAHT